MGIGRIVGQAIDIADELPIPFVRVELRRKGEGTREGFLAVTATDANGNYKFEAEPGEYDVVLMSPVHEPVRGQVKVEQDKEVVFNLRTGRITL